MKPKRPKKPNDEDNIFHTIWDLLDKKIPAAALADAIEKHGICTYDQYGRFDFTDEKGKARALYLLEIYYKWDSTAPEERDPEDPRSPMDQWGCCSDNQYAHFGWTDEVIPKFDNFQFFQSTEKKETPSERRERLSARVKEEKRKGTKAFLQMIAEEEGVSISRIKQIIYKKTPNSSFKY